MSWQPIAALISILTRPSRSMPALAQRSMRTAMQSIALQWSRDRSRQFILRGIGSLPRESMARSATFCAHSFWQSSRHREQETLLNPIGNFSHGHCSDSHLTSIGRALERKERRVRAAGQYSTSFRVFFGRHRRWGATTAGVEPVNSGPIQPPPVFGPVSKKALLVHAVPMRGVKAW